MSRQPLGFKTKKISMDKLSDNPLGNQQNHHSIKNQSNEPSVLPQTNFDTLVINGNNVDDVVKQICMNNQNIPVIMGELKDFQKNLKLLQQGMQTNKASYNEIIEKSNHINLDDYINDIINSDSDIIESIQGDPDEIVSFQNLSIAKDPKTKQYKQNLVIGLFPVQKSWQIPALLKLGGWNACPPPEIHTAIWKRWFERYGAVVSWLTFDELELAIEKPPKGIEEARQIALELYAYCGDLFQGGICTINNVAKTVMSSRYWSFWWD